MAHRLIPVLFIANWLLFTVWLNTGSLSFAEATIVVPLTNDTLPDRGAAFGPSIVEDGLSGRLIPLSFLHPSNIYACQPVTPPDLSDWIALVERGQCSFIDKVRNMQSSGAIAVAVGDKDRNGLVTMYAAGDTSDVLIPSVFLAQQQYLLLLKLFEDFGDEPLQITLFEDDFQWPFLDIIIVVVLSPTIVMIFAYTLWRVRAQQRRKKDLAPVQVVDNLPTKIFYKEKKKENEPEECVICLEDFVDEDELRVLPCKHEFHIPCIDGWLTKQKKFCPICKRDVCPLDTESAAAAAPTEQTPLLSGSSSNPVPVAPAGAQAISPRNSPPPAAISSQSSSA